MLLLHLELMVDLFKFFFFVRFNRLRIEQFRLFFIFFVFVLFIIIFNNVFIIDSIVQLTIILVLVLSVSVPTARSEEHDIVFDHIVYRLMERRKMRFGWVERGKYDWFSWTVLDQGIVRWVQSMFCEEFKDHLSIPVQPPCLIVCEFFSDNIFLCLSENFHFIFRVFHPRMAQNLSWGDAFFWIHLKHPPLKVFSIFSPFLNLIISLYDHLVKIAHVRSFKRNCPMQHWKQNYACRPNIYASTTVSPINQNFRSDISWGSTLLHHHFVVTAEFTDSKIADFDSSVVV